MPTFTAISLDTLLEPRKPVSIPPSASKLKRTTSTTIPTTTTEKKKAQKAQWARVSPALYATPEAIPVPDYPSSFPPSPYIINHKRRGPRLLKSSLSVDNVSLQQKDLEDVVLKVGDVNGEKVQNGDLDNGVDGIEDLASGVDGIENFGNGDFSFAAPSGLDVNGFGDKRVGNDSKDVGVNGFIDNKVKNDRLGGTKNGETDYEFDDFFDPQESMSVASNTEIEETSVAAAARSCKQGTPTGDFFDACEELSSEGITLSSVCDVESELREIRLNLLMEIERRKQSEEALSTIQIQWQRLRQQLSLVGLTLPEIPAIAEEDDNLDPDPSEELCQQIHLARAVSNSIGRASAKAEVEREMESQIEAKDFEIARLWDRIRYYEAVNHEIFQRKQEAVEMERRFQEKRKIKQKWTWASIAAAITLGSSALAWSYLPTAKGSLPPNFSHAPDGND